MAYAPHDLSRPSLRQHPRSSRSRSYHIAVPHRPRKSIYDVFGMWGVSNPREEAGEEKNLSITMDKSVWPHEASESGPLMPDANLQARQRLADVLGLSPLQHPLEADAVKPHTSPVHGRVRGKTSRRLQGLAASRGLRVLAPAAPLNAPEDDMDPEHGLNNLAHANLRDHLDTENLVWRIDVCADAVVQTSLCLRACPLLKDPGAIAELCEHRLTETLTRIRRALEKTPTTSSSKGKGATPGSPATAKSWLLWTGTSSTSIGSWTMKFADLARRIAISHEKLRAIDLRTVHEFLGGVRRQARQKQAQIREDIREAKVAITNLRRQREDPGIEEELDLGAEA
ncbi:uncharacterized protein BXZ73DRAFT_100585 [Epithele typhae]|uniref:uncharacterized protein n=1 Tax=Epithele typhae TaxID=378194 RepID=UPI00200776D5|nr:uncharacterized protein BXZ73DRAFT_100585 [Epithele typhae]KAH9935198.1 hypothetical protein BXZ73DRAFT_100585 [Epithele typhae]